ncbi:dynamin family protein [Chengkuizengella sediminis]|uniref:dynamin family protein n=1 Tax=Chengkuizengella sediminis TaxID=1885917 RepID=UPI001389AF11|nr:dynamin family protein [Chengkuizengella sediminis]NDI34451.1 GTP-binding protein [Chengkuizengella sediminis]
MKTVGETIHKYVENIHKLRSIMKHSDEQESGNKLLQLADKMEVKDLYITFCGHFSAGKSSLINKLSEHEILPSSPIPTSANLVAISNGEPKAIIKYRNEQKTKQSIQNIKLDQLQEFSKNGSEIESVEIQYPIPMLENHVHFLDTPGIDSTDKAHLLSTESALHLADIVFYVMDYNHVQSEINFAFAKRLQEQGKKFVFIVNQIDKHQHHELSFSDFKQSVYQAFSDWDIHPEALFFISVKHEDFSLNEFDQLKWYLNRLTEIRDELIISNVEKSIEFILNEHIKEYKEQNQIKKQELSEKEYINSDILLEKLSSLSNQRKEIEEASNTYLDQLKRELSGILQNANIIPAGTRDLAHEYLQSRQPGFKLGLFSTRGKIQAEQEKRLHHFYEDFSEKVQAHISWHVKDLLLKHLKLNRPNEQLKSETIEKIEELDIKISPDWLMQQVNMGAAFSNEYTLNYSKHISEEMKAIYRKKAMEVAQNLVEIAKKTNQEKLNKIQHEMSHIQDELVNFKQLQELKSKQVEYEQQLFSLFQWEKQDICLPNLKDYTPSSSSIAANKIDKVEVKKIDESMDIVLSSSSYQKNLISNFSKKDNKEKIINTVNKINTAYEVIRDLPAMKSISKSLLEKSDRLSNRKFTISLFGAFSAGKSSFANALLGERLLPVSPNPTTATVIKIMPPDDHWSHGFAKVKLKSLEVFKEEVQYAMDRLGFKKMTLDQSFQQILKLKANSIHRKAKPHFVFLKAATHGWNEMQSNLGQELKVDLGTFQSYAADENKSCYVEHIELYYSCPFTDSGMILVDTPGADSINARHTGVAFDYIKSADAILFVTYYNHAFSGADREFLLQLGRVKDQFELDKMFFILNAADLASSEQELRDVTVHVTHNLAQHEIRNPRIYPLSSLKALEGKQSGDAKVTVDSGIATFELDFIKFTNEELTEITIQAANSELTRVTNVLKQWKNNALEEGEIKKQKVKQLEESNIELNDWLYHFEHSEPEVKLLIKEIKELLYYVKQRVMYRFGELYNISFHPSDFQSTGKVDVKQALASAWNELNRLLSMNCSQEVLATTLRIENVMNHQLKEMNKQIFEHVAIKLPQYETEAFSIQSFEAPPIKESLDHTEIDLIWLVKQFKNPKVFFEGQGKDKLKLELEKKINPVVESYIREHEGLLIQHVLEEMKKWIKQLVEKHTTDIQEHVEGLTSVLEMKLNIKEIEMKIEKLDNKR